MGARENPPDVKGIPAASLIAVGFLSMLGQVVLLRELAVASFGVELIYILGLGIWLAAGAAGAAAGRDGASGPPPRPGAPFLLVAAILPFSVAFLRGARLLFGGVPGAYLPLGQQAATAALALVPAGFVMGLLFRRAARWFVSAGGTLAAAYAWESAGGAIGSVAATLSLHRGVPNLALGVCCGIAGAFAARAAWKPGVSRLWPVAALGIFLALLARSDSLDRRMTGWNHPALVASADTPYGRVAITRAAGQTAVFENDAVAYESEGTEAEEFVHLAALQVPAGSRVLALGGGAAGIAAEVLRHRPSKLDYVEGNRAMYRALLPHLPGESRRALADAAVRVIFADPRRFLAEAPVYDLILVVSPEPSSGQSNRFYTEEFFRLCAARLSPEGVVALRLPSSENFATPRLLRRNGSVYAALGAAFPDILVFPGSTDTFLASRSPLSRDPGELAARLRERGIAARLVTPEYLRYLLSNDRFAQAGELLARAGAPPNTDVRPACYRETALLWLGKFLPGAETADPPDRLSWAALAGLALAAIVAARRRPAWRRAMVVAVAGFGGMVVEAVVLLRYQAESGSLYRDIGILLTSFMAGLAAGAFAFDRTAGMRGSVPRWWGALLLGGLAFLSAGLAAAAETGGMLFRPVPSAVVLAAAGGVVAGIFGYASRAGVEDQGKAVAPLYAADLLGGCIGSVLAGLFLIPAFGVGATSAGAAFLAVAALLLL